MRFVRRSFVLLRWAALAILGGCATQTGVHEARRAADARAEIVRLLPATTQDREGWATDIAAAFAALDIDPATPNLCAALAIAGQESDFASDPVVPGLGS